MCGGLWRVAKLADKGAPMATTSDRPQEPTVQKASAKLVIFGFMILGTFFGLIVGSAIVIAEWMDEPDVIVEAPPVPATATPPPTPSVTLPEATLTPELTEKLLYFCQGIAKSMLELNEAGLTETETVLYLANEWDTTLEAISTSIAICVDYVGDQPVE